MRMKLQMSNTDKSKTTNTPGRGVLGGPGLNSKSPYIHKSFGDGDYQVYRAAPEELGRFVCESRLAGYNVTMPHKVSIMEYLDEISPEARCVGAVNTVAVKPDGKKIGYNTDILGFRDALAFHGIFVKNKKVCVLGSGGASKAVRYACEKENSKAVVVVSRSGEVNYSNTAAYADADVLVNCTPVGMGKGNAESPIDIGIFTRLTAVNDLIYDPNPTRLVYEARQRGINAHGGLYMLVAQAAYSRELFGEGFSGGDMIKTLYRELSPNTAVFIGMPGAGKTKLGKLAADAFGLSFADADEVIEKEMGMSITEIFDKFGEARFRELEKEAIKKLAENPPGVVSVGGGAVKDGDNRYYIKSMGRVYWVVRDIGLLDKTGRPLSIDLQKLACERYPLYESLCDVRLDNNGRISVPLERFAADRKN